MSSHGIKDRVAIVGMSCTKFAEHFDKSLDDLLLEATEGAYASAGVDRSSIDLYNHPDFKTLFPDPHAEGVR